MSRYFISHDIIFKITYHRHTFYGTQPALNQKLKKKGILYMELLVPHHM